MGVEVYFRLNVFSDIDWRDFTNELKNISFYDYTKVWDRVSTDNYHLTFSASETTDKFSIFEKVTQGENVAVVFNVKKGCLPNKFLDLDVFNGEVTDNRYADPKGVIVGLVLKNTSHSNENHKANNLDNIFAFKVVA